jgi:hypothetical protein
VRPQQIDDLTRRDHYYLAEQDLCYFFLDYSARNGRSFSAANELIGDLLRPEGQRNLVPDVRKQRAIRRVAHLFKAALNAERMGAITYVPLPPPRTRNQLEGDDRMARVLRCLADEPDIREMIEMDKTRETGDFAGIRIGPDVLSANMRVVQALLEPRPELIFLVGDVLTTGANFVAAKRRLQQFLPYVPIYGLYAARKARDADDIANLDA